MSSRYARIADRARARSPPRHVINWLGNCSAPFSCELLSTSRAVHTVQNGRAKLRQGIWWRSCNGTRSPLTLHAMRCPSPTVSAGDVQRRQPNQTSSPLLRRPARAAAHRSRHGTSAGTSSTPAAASSPARKPSAVPVQISALSSVRWISPPPHRLHRAASPSNGSAFAPQREQIRRVLRRRANSSCATTMFTTISGPLLRSARIVSSASACARVRGNPSSTNPPAVSDSRRRARTIAIMVASSTSFPCSMVALTWSPSGVGVWIASRKMSPVEIFGRFRSRASRSARVLFPAPGGPIMTMFILSRPPDWWPVPDEEAARCMCLAENSRGARRPHALIFSSVSQWDGAGRTGALVDVQRDLVNLVGLVPCAFVDPADGFVVRSLGQTGRFTGLRICPGVQEGNAFGRFKCEIAPTLGTCRPCGRSDRPASFKHLGQHRQIACRLQQRCFQPFVAGVSCDTVAQNRQ